MSALAHDEVVAVHQAVLGELLAGHFLEAQLHCLRALERGPQTAELLYLMAVVCRSAGQFDHAVEWASRAVSQNGANPGYLAYLGAVLQQQARHEEAVQAFDRAVTLKPDDVELWSQLGDACVAAGRQSEALACFRHVLELDPQRGDAAYKAGHLLHGTGELDEALGLLNRSADLQPHHVPTLQARAVVLKNLNRMDEALADNRRAIALDPANADVCINMANLLQTLERHDEALSWYDRASQIKPNSGSVTNRAMSLTALARFEDAMAAYRHALDIDPNEAKALWNLSLLQLLTGDFAAGWRAREARWKVPELTAYYPDMHKPMWLGEEPIAGKTIVVCQTEGLGDGIHFMRYVPMLAERGARIILLVDPPLYPLVRGLAGVSLCLVKSPQTEVPPFDFHVAIDSLPLAFATKLDTIPAAESYLPAPDAERIEAWERRLGPRRKLRVGLVWSGNSTYRNDRNRSMPFRTLSGLLDVDATFVSLQKDPRPQDAEALRERADIVDFTADLSDFAETAALVSCLDLVIAVDTSVAHLSGALGRPTWLLLPFVPDWRWLLDRDDSPWYPTVRLFRQTETREYGSVIARVRMELAVLAESWKSGDAR
jgi:tetratricopeptide (TPR) repeat protein